MHVTERINPAIVGEEGRNGRREDKTKTCTPAESSSLSYGLAVHLLLLSTLSRDSAVAVDYKLR
jgi:hypothetical protein